MKLDYSTLKTLTEDEAFDAVLDLAKSNGFPATSFQSGDIGYSLLKTLAQIISLTSEPVENIVKNLLVSTAIGSALDILGVNFFNESRQPSSYSIIQVKMKNDGILAVSREALECKIKVFYGTDISTGEDIYVTFSNRFAFNINASSSLLVDFISENKGESSRVSGSNIPEFVIDIPLVTFQSISADTGYFNLVSNGNNVETDDDYRKRLLSKWGSLSSNTPEEALKYYVSSAINASGNPVDVERIYIDMETAAFSGSCVLYLASSTGSLSEEDLTACNLSVQKYRGINDIIFVDNAVENVINYNMQITANTTYTDAVLIQKITDALTKYYSTINIGGTKLAATSAGFVLTSEIIDYIMGIDSIIDCKITTKTSNSVFVTSQDIQLSYEEIPVISADQINSISISRV